MGEGPYLREDEALRAAHVEPQGGEVGKHASKELPQPQRGGTRRDGPQVVHIRVVRVPGGMCVCPVGCACARWDVRVPGGMWVCLAGLVSDVSWTCRGRVCGACAPVEVDERHVRGPAPLLPVEILARAGGVEVEQVVVVRLEGA